MIRHHVEQVASGNPFDWRILANGYLDELGYERIYLTTGFRQPEAVGLYLGHGYTALFDPPIDPETPRKLPFEKHLDTGRHHGRPAAQRAEAVQR